MLLDHELLKKLLPLARNKDIDSYLDPLNDTLTLFEINTPKRIAAFIAQVAIESGSLFYKEEIASGKAYDGRKNLGNDNPIAIAAAKLNMTSTGRFYKGRGLLQTTGYYNYKLVGHALGLDLVNYPSLLLKPINACRAAGWFWKTHNCNALADMSSSRTNFALITKKINGGLTAEDKRHDAWLVCKEVLEC